MNAPLAKRVGRALVWKLVQMCATRAVSLVGTLVLARLLMPEDFGLLAIGMITIEILLSLSDLGMRPALLQRNELQPGHYDAAWTAEVARGATVTLVAIVFAPLISQIFEEPRAENVIRALAFMPFLTSAGSIKVVDLERSLQFRPLAIMSASAAIAHFAVAIFLAPTFGVWALVAGVVGGGLSGSFLSYLVAPYLPHPSFDPVATRSLYQFGKWIFLTGIVGVLGGAILQTIIGRDLGTVELGLYYLAARLAFLPNQMISEAASEVAFPLHARFQSESERARRTFRASLIGSWAVLIPAYALLIALTPQLVEEILGSRWSGTEPIIRLLSVAGIIGGVADATMPLLKGRGRPQDVAALYAIRTLILIVLISGLISRWNLIGAALAFLLAEIGSQLWCVFVSRRVLDRPFQGIGRSICAIAGASAGGVLVAITCEGLLGGPVGVTTAALVGFGATALILWYLDRRLDLGLTADLLQAFPELGRVLPYRGPRPASNRAGVAGNAVSGHEDPGDDPPMRL